MSVIYVKAKTGRVVRATSRGAVLPNDDFVPVVVTPHVNRLIALGDVDVKPDDPKPKPKRTAEPPMVPVATPPVSE